MRYEGYDLIFQDLCGQKKVHNLWGPGNYLFVFENDSHVKTYSLGKELAWWAKGFGNGFALIYEVHKEKEMTKEAEKEIDRLNLDIEILLRDYGEAQSLKRYELHKEIASLQARLDNSEQTFKHPDYDLLNEAYRHLKIENKQLQDLVEAQRETIKIQTKKVSELYGLLDDKRKALTACWTRINTLEKESVTFPTNMPYVGPRDMLYVCSKCGKPQKKCRKCGS